MKYFLLLAASLLLTYSLYTIICGLADLGHFLNYGMGVILGGMLLLSLGLLLLRFALKLFKQK